MIVFQCILIALIAYLIGSIPTGYIIVKKLKNMDIRQIGSGSTGATNVKRALGTKWFIIVMVLDAIKGFIPTFLVSNYVENFNIAGINTIIAATAVIIGHCKPLFLGFAGGKSVATGIGTLIAICPAVGFSCAGIWAFITFFTKYVSLGSVIAVALTPLLMTIFCPITTYQVYTGILGVIIILTHKDNISRLLNGNENKINRK